MALNKVDMGLDDIIKMNKKAGKKQLPHQLRPAGNRSNQRRAQTGFKTSYKLKQQNVVNKGRGNIRNAGNRAQTLKRNSGHRRAQQSVKEARARQAANRAEILNRQRKIEKLEPVPTTSKKPLAPQGILQSDIVSYELEKRRKATVVMAAATAKRDSEAATIPNKNTPRRRLDRSKFGGVAAATLEISLNNTNNNSASRSRARRGRVQVNPAVKGQVTQIQTQITKLQNKLSNIQKRQLFQMQAQGKANRRAARPSIQRNTMRSANPKVTIKQRIGKPNNKKAQANSRRKVIW